MKFDKNRLMNNINVLIKEKKLKIGNIEAEIGISTGYLSRMSKAENDTMPGIDLIWKLAEKLEVSVDALVGCDFGRANDNLLYMAKFVRALTEDTNCHKLVWEQFHKAEKLQGKYITGSLPMISGKLTLNMVGNRSYYSFYSMFDAGSKLEMTKNNYCARIKGLGVGFLFRLERGMGEDREIIYELYAVRRDSEGIEQVVPICSTLKNEGAIGPYIKDLYHCVVRHEMDLKVSEEARSLINSYMGKRETGELPFI